MARLNIEDTRAYDRRLYAENAEFRRKRNAKSKAYRKAHPKRHTETSAASRGHCPTWANRKALKAFYEATPEGMEVDHVLPLKGEKVSGLHVLENLQYLTRSDNSKKGNR